MKKSYYCPTCKKFVKEWYTDPFVMGRGRTIPSTPTGGGMTVKICKKCDTVLMEFVED